MSAVPSIEVRVQAERFDQQRELERLRGACSDIGALAAFTGICRDEGGRLKALELEHFAGMAEAEIHRIATEAAARFGLSGIVVVHRHGIISPGEDIVLVAAASAHRDAAFDGARFVMDFLKTQAPFWKKEHPADGNPGEWVSAVDKDDLALGKWSRS